MEGIKVFDRPALQSRYAVAGRLLFIESFDRRLARLIERLFAGWQLSPVCFADRNPNVKITFYCGESPLEIPAGLTHFEVAEGGRCYSAGEQLYLQFDNSLLHLQSGTPVAVELWLKQLPGPTDAEMARMTSFAVCAALRRFGLFELHAAGVVVPNSEAGVLIVGSSGSGKSTLTLQLVTAGWGYLSDDELLLSMVNEQVEARGFRSFFALSQEGTVATGGVKTCFEPARVFASAPRARVLPRYLLFTGVSGEQETQLRELSQVETMTRLLRACPWATYDREIARPNLELLSGLARQTRGFDLKAGRDLLDPADAARIIASVCH